MITKTNGDRARSDKTKNDRFGSSWYREIRYIKAKWKEFDDKNPTL
jgi:hypothetical protein